MPHDMPKPHCSLRFQGVVSIKDALTTTTTTTTTNKKLPGLQQFLLGHGQLTQLMFSIKVMKRKI
jgi:hypothetical protein